MRTPPDGILSRFMREFTFLLGASPKTARNYGYNLAAFSKWMGHSRWETYTREDFKQWVIHLSVAPMKGGKKQRGAHTIYAHIKAVRTFWRWMIQEEIVEKDITEGVRGPRLMEPRLDIPDESQLATIMEACARLGETEMVSARNRLLPAFLFDTLMRVGAEALNLDVGDVLTVEGLVRTEINFLSTKTGDRRRVAVSRDLRQLLEEYLSVRVDRFCPDFLQRPLFVTRDYAGRLTYHGARRLIVEVNKGLGFHFRFHQLRHAGAVALLEAGVSELNTQDILGHSDLTMTRRYTRHNALNRAVSAHREHSPLGRLQGTTDQLEVAGVGNGDSIPGGEGRGEGGPGERDEVSGRVRGGWAGAGRREHGALAKGG